MLVAVTVSTAVVNRDTADVPIVEPLIWRSPPVTEPEPPSVIVPGAVNVTVPALPFNAPLSAIALAPPVAMSMAPVPLTAVAIMEPTL